MKTAICQVPHTVCLLFYILRVTLHGTHNPDFTGYAQEPPQDLLTFTELWVAEPAIEARGKAVFPLTGPPVTKTKTLSARLGQQQSLAVFVLEL